MNLEDFKKKIEFFLNKELSHISKAKEREQMVMDYCRGQRDAYTVVKAWVEQLEEDLK